MNIVFLDTATLQRDDIDFSPFEQFGQVTHHPRTLPEETSERIKNADIVITNKVVISAQNIAQASKLKLICAAATGVNHLDLEAAKTHGVAACNVSGYSTEAVAQHAFAFILSLASQLHRYAPEASEWPKSPLFTRLDHPIFELSGKTLGIVGLGTIGKEVAKIGKAFNMNVIALARSESAPCSEIPRLAADDFFPTADIISLHSPLTPETQNLINAETLSLFKKSALLINTARGQLIDETALANALRQKKIAGAGLDVLSSEPPASDHPLLADDLPNLLITPHTAWAAFEARQRLVLGLLDNIQGFLLGNLPNRVA